MVQEIFIVNIKAVYLPKVLVSSYNDDSENSRDDQNYENDNNALIDVTKQSRIT